MTRALSELTLGGDHENFFLAADLDPNLEMYFRDPDGLTPTAESGASNIAQFLKRYFATGWGILLNSGSLASAIPTQEFGPRIVPFNMTLTSLEMVAVPITGQPSGSIVVDVWVDTYANWPLTVSDSIVGSGAKPTISSALKAQDSDLSDYADLTLAAGSWAKFNVVSCSNLAVVALKYNYDRTS